MKFKNKSFIIVLTVFSAAGCVTSTDIISETPEKRTVESNSQEEINKVKNYETVENKTSKISELKIVHLPEHPGE